MVARFEHTGEKPAVSVVIPAYNEEVLLPGILAQFTDERRRRFGMEIIVSDGGSSDRTVEIARRMADVVVEHTNHVRQTIALGRNAGANVARGEVLVFVNADTVIEDFDTFFGQTLKVVHCPGISGVTCSVGVHKEDERCGDRLFHGLYNWYFWFLNILGIGMGRGECQIVRKELFDDLGGYNDQIAAGEDFDFFHRLRRRGTIAFLRTARVRESPRRFRRYGYLYVSGLWLLNAVWVLLFHRSVTSEWKPIR